MSAEQHARAAEVFEAALWSDAPEAYVRSACGDDQALLTEVTSLLAARARSAGFLESSPMDARIRELRPGETFAGYRIVRRIGRGGGGVVYEAEQANPRRSVALKVLRRLADPAGTGDRFVREAELLASLRHPHIAHIYEAGVADAHAFLVVELVEDAQDLLAHPAEHGMDARERLQLFIRTCDAVQYAHQKGVAHCDLKPANILVAGGGHPKLIDFGIARLADDAHGARAGTPPYMSPEQRDGLGSDARSDVYALGVILRELVSASADAREPLPTGRRLELEAIVRQAAAPDPAERYASAGALADDVRRFLARRPVEARDGGALYQIACFARRHTVAFGLLCALVLVSTGAALIGTWLAVERDRERDVAREERDRAEWQSYVASMSAAESALRAYDVGAARRQLAAAPTAHRDWEWRHLMQRLDSSARTLQHTQSSEHGAVSPDGRLAAGGARQVVIWDLESGKRLQVLSPSSSVISLAFDSSSTRLALGDAQGSLSLVQAKSGAVAKSWSAHAGKVWALCWVPGTARLLSAGYDGRIHLWTEVGAKLATWETSDTRPFSLDVRGDVIWCGAQDGSLWQFSLSGSFEPRRHAAHDASVEGVVASSDGRMVATGSMDRSVCLWDAETLERLWIGRAHRSGVKGLALDETRGQVAACSVDRTITIWDLSSGRLASRCMGHTDFVRTVAYRAASDSLVSFSRDGTIKLWPADVPSSVPALVGHEQEARALSWGADDLLLSVTATGVSHGWQLGQSTPKTRTILDWDEHRSGLLQVFSRAPLRTVGRRKDGRVCVWALPSGAEIAVLGRGGASAITADGKHAYVAFGRTLTKWSVPDARVLHTWKLAGHVQALAVHGQLVAVTLPDAVHIGDEAQFVEYDIEGLRRLAFSRDGMHLAGAAGDTIVLLRHWRSGGRVMRLEGHTARVEAVDWAPSGTRLASASNDGTVRLWDPLRGVPVLVLHGHAEYATALAWSDDGTILASAGGNSGREACRLLLWRSR